MVNADDECSQDFFIPVTAKLPRTLTSSSPRLHWFPLLEGSETESPTQVTKTWGSQSSHKNTDQARQHSPSHSIYTLNPYQNLILIIMSGRLQGKTAIVTGGASGFGKGIATKFISEGANVIITDLNEQQGQAVAQELSCSFTRADVTNPDDWRRVLEFAIEKYKQLDIVVNNAGAAYSKKPTEEVTPKDFDLVMNVNVKSVYYSTNVLVPYFLKEGKPVCFIQVASTAGIRPRPELTWYNASKAAVINATKTMAVEYGPKQIRFNSVSPVVGSTGM